MEFQSGATATISCSQSFGTPAARALLGRKSNAETIIRRKRRIPKPRRAGNAICPVESGMNKKIALFLLVLFSLAAYAPALRNGFVWDDQALILRDPLIRSWQLIPEGFMHFLFTDATASDFYRPLQRAPYNLNYAICLLSPRGYHLVSLLWHAAAAVALFYFAEEFLATCKMEPAHRLWVAFLGALFWALHPAQNAAVVYVAGRADPLAATFGF